MSTGRVGALDSAESAALLANKDMTILSTAYGVPSGFELHKRDGLWGVRPRRLHPTLEDLHNAIRMKNLAKVRFVLSELPKRRMDSSIRSTTALSLAVYQGCLPVVLALLHAGADPNKLSSDWSQRIESPISSAARLGQLEVAEALLNFGADADAIDEDGHSPLWIATRERSLGMVKLLVNRSARLDVSDSVSHCPLYLATKFYGREGIAAHLVASGCRLDVADGEGRTPLYWAIVNGMEELSRVLLKGGAPVSARALALVLGRPPPALLDRPHFRAWLRRKLTTPPKLGRLARGLLRRQLRDAAGGRGIQPRIEVLPLPTELRWKLSLSDHQGTRKQC